METKTFPSFTQHGLNRLEERCPCMTPEKLTELLTSDQTVLLGLEGHKEHRLFFDDQEERWYVAVVDSGNGDVITILYPDYRAASFRVDWASTMRLAEMLVRGVGPVPEVPEKKPAPVSQLPPQVYRLTAYVHQGGNHFQVGLKSFPIDRSKTAKETVSGIPFREHVQTSLQQKGFPPASVGGGTLLIGIGHRQKNAVSLPLEVFLQEIPAEAPCGDAAVGAVHQNSI